MGLCESKSDKKALINENNNNSEKINNPKSSQINQITNSQNNSQIKEKTPNSIIKESIKSAEEKSNKNENIPSVLKSQNNISQTSGIKNSTIYPLNILNSQIKKKNSKDLNKRAEIEKELNIQRNLKNKNKGPHLSDMKMNQLNYYNEIAKNNAHNLMNNPTLKDIIQKYQIHMMK